MFLIDADGRRLRRLASAAELAGRGGGCSWSPDGRQVLFESRGGIWVVPAAGGRPTRLGAGFGPDWSPDGRMILFVASAGDQTGIWVMDTAGRGRHLLVRRAGNGGVAWKP